MIDQVLLERFKRHVMFLDDSDDSCWIWTGALRDDGRGRFFVNGKKQRPAQRVAWELLHGEPVPEDRRLVQECSHPQCVRHWRLGGRKRLTTEERMMILASHLSPRKLAEKLHISRGAVEYIRSLDVLSSRCKLNPGDDYA